MIASERKNTGLSDRIWNFFSSITLAVVVFSAISVTSVIGTLIEQQAEPERNIKLLAKLVGSSAPAVYRVIDALGFTNMYHSWWFLALLFIFAGNLIICSLDRLPKILKLVKEPVGPLKPEQFGMMPIKREVSLKAGPGSGKDAIAAALRKIGFKAVVSEGENGAQVYAERGRYSRLGVYITHLSILLILTGAVIGVLFGFNGSLNLPEGVTSPFVFKGNGEKLPLGFEIRCDDFDVSYYDNSDSPKSYRSWLTILENGREALKKEIDVNSPLKYKGITFYQASYGYSPTRDSLFRFTVTANNGRSENIQLKFGESFMIPGTQISGRVADFSPAIGQDQSGRLITYAEMMINPAVFLEFSENGNLKYRQWILKRLPQTWRTPDGVIEFKDLWGAQYTGLQVRKDPGVWIVYLGCIVMAIGLYAAFFMSHARVWVWLGGDKKTVKVAVAASSNKNKAAFEQKIDKFIKALTKPEV